MMKTLRFYEEPDGKWYVDLPDWKGTKEALEMVAGADTMLKHISEGKTEVKLKTSEYFLKDSSEIVFQRMATEIGEGAFYKLEKYVDANGVASDMTLDMWLCDVLKYVFGKFPKHIYFQKVY